MLLFAWVVLYKCMSCWHSCKIPLDIFIYVVLYSAIPFAHWTWLQGGLESGIVIAKMKQTIMPFVSGGIGLLFYLTRFPEKLFTGSVDILGASHQVCLHFCSLWIFPKIDSYFKVPIFFSNRFGMYWFFLGWLVGMLRLTKVLPLKNFPVQDQMNSMSQTAYLTTY